MVDRGKILRQDMPKILDEVERRSRAAHAAPQ
jgi:hypothetical protein